MLSIQIELDFETLLKVIDQLPVEQKRILKQHLGDNAESASVPALKKRVPGLGEGTIHMRDDFDAPLPDEFWLGEDT